VGNQYPPVEKWRERASYFEVPGARLQTALHRATDPAARVLPVGPFASASHRSSAGVPSPLLQAPGTNAPGARLRLGGFDYLKCMIRPAGEIRSAEAVRISLEDRQKS
jgi:hypothetical protein